MVGLEGLVLAEVDVHDLLGVSTVVVLDDTTRGLDGRSALLGGEVGLLDAETSIFEAAGHPELAEAAAEDARLVTVDGGDVARRGNLLADVTELLGGLDATAVGNAVDATEHLGASHGLVVGAAAIDALEDALRVDRDDGDGGLGRLLDLGGPAAALEDTNDVLGGEGLLLGRGGGGKAGSHFRDATEVWKWS